MQFLSCILPDSISVRSEVLDDFSEDSVMSLGLGFEIEMPFTESFFPSLTKFSYSSSEFGV